MIDTQVRQDIEQLVRDHVLRVHKNYNETKEETTATADLRVCESDDLLTYLDKLNVLLESSDSSVVDEVIDNLPFEVLRRWYYKVHQIGMLVLQSTRKHQIRGFTQLADDVKLKVIRAPQFDPRIDKHVHEWHNSGITADMYANWLGKTKTVHEIFEEWMWTFEKCGFSQDKNNAHSDYGYFAYPDEWDEEGDECRPDLDFETVKEKYRLCQAFEEDWWDGWLFEDEDGQVYRLTQEGGGYGPNFVKTKAV